MSATSDRDHRPTDALSSVPHRTGKPPRTENATGNRPLPVNPSVPPPGNRPLQVPLRRTCVRSRPPRRVPTGNTPRVSPGRPCPVASRLRELPAPGQVDVVAGPSESEGAASKRGGVVGARAVEVSAAANRGPAGSRGVIPDVWFRGAVARRHRSTAASGFRKRHNLSALRSRSWSWRASGRDRWRWGWGQRCRTTVGLAATSAGRVGPVFGCRDGRRGCGGCCHGLQRSCRSRWSSAGSRR